MLISKEWNNFFSLFGKLGKTSYFLLMILMDIISEMLKLITHHNIYYISLT